MKRKNVINAAKAASNFYKKGKAIYGIGRSVGNAISTGAKITSTLKRKYRKLTHKRRPRHLTSNVGSHNDWNSLPRKVFIVGSKTPPKIEGTYQLVHAKDYIAEDTGTGYQHVGDGVCCFSRYQLGGTSISTNVTNYQYLWGTNPFLLNPYSVPPTANSIYTTASTVPIDADKIVVKSVESKIQIVNLSPTAMKIRIYWLLCNKNSDDLPSVAWDEVLDEQKYLQPSAAVGPTGTVATTNTVGYESKTLHGQELPPHFSKRWKTIHKDVFMMQPGDNQSMTRVFVYNRAITKQQLSENTTQHLKGWTLCPLVVTEGALVGLAADSETAGSTHIDRCTFARTKIGYLHTDKITFAAVGTSRYDIRRNEIGYVQGNTTNITQIIDADDEAINANPMD